MKYRHYSPRAKVVLINPKSSIRIQQSCAFIGLDEPAEKFALKKICSSVEEYAHEVFAFFREADAVGIKTIYCQTVEESGIGRALIDRLKRAAS